MSRIYLDYAAATPIDKRVAKAMRDFELEFFGNPSSQHREGQKARARIDLARDSIAKFLNASPQEIVFTSGATEANNLAVHGVVDYAINKFKIKPHIITTKLEHQSVYNLVKELKDRGVVEVTFIQPKKDGTIAARQVIEAIKENTVLISTIFVSNEIGTILPIREIGKELSAINSQLSTKIAYHVDAVQAAKFYNLNVEKLGCDLLTLSAHKIHGPKGVGALYIKDSTKLENLMIGGSQEYGKRPGTQNTAGIIGFAKAVEVLGPLVERQNNADNIAKLRDYFIHKITKLLQVELNGPVGEARIADNISITVYNIDQDALMTALDLAGIAASTGSACVSGSTQPSHVIEALGKIGTQQAATVRFTLGKDTKKSQIDFTINALTKTVPSLRKNVDVDYPGNQR